MTTPVNPEYDIIFAGGGTSACVIAGRLAAADPSIKILILEAGGHTKGLPEHIRPALYFNNMTPSSKTFSFHVANPSDHLGGRSLIVPSGKCLGGGSIMMYTRAACSDYDDWETVYRNPGWGSKDLIPLLKKTEDFQVKPGAATHGYSGPLKVSYGGIFTNIGQQFLDAVALYDEERGFTEDVNGLFSCNAYGKWPKWIDAATGKRSDVPHHFIYDKEYGDNLDILVGCTVKRVIIQNNRAVGVEYINETTAGAHHSVSYVHASRLVVVSAGAFGSPTILERSGIGGKAVLEKNSVNLVVDLPGVGENYQDHNGGFVPYMADEKADSLDGILTNDKDVMDECISQWSTGKGMMAHNGIDAGIKIRPNEEDLMQLGSEFKKIWEAYFVPAPDKPVCWIGPIAGFFGDRLANPKRKYFTMVYFTDYPVSRGHVHIRSGDDAHAAPDFDSGFLREPADLSVLRWGYKKSRELARRIAFYRGELASMHPKFAEGSDASCQNLDSSINISAPDIVYTAEDDKAIDEYHRLRVSTTWHSMGTCAMKPRDQLGVVDERLNVYGVQGLKVADLSIAPGNVGANTYSTALVIAEKAAIMIGEELGIIGV